MKNYLVICLTLTLIACGPSQGEKEKIAAVSCAVLSETRDVDAAIRVEKMNEAREKIGGEPFLRGDDTIKESLEYGLCEDLVLDVAVYDESLLKKIEIERIADSKPTVKEEFHPNGELKRRTNYRGFNRHGLMRTWRDNGQLRYETTYKNGKEHGLGRWWHENGQLGWEITYKDVKEHGLFRSWRENGQLWREASYKDGKEHGVSKQWNEDGQLWTEKCYSNGKTVDMSNCKV